MFIHDQRNAIKRALNQGREEGMEKGLEKGREEGREEGIRQVAQQLKAAGMAIAQVSQITGLSIKGIDAL